MKETHASTVIRQAKEKLENLETRINGVNGLNWREYAHGHGYDAEIDILIDRVETICGQKVAAVFFELIEEKDYGAGSPWGERLVFQLEDDSTVYALVSSSDFFDGNTLEIDGTLSEKEDIGDITGDLEILFDVDEHRDAAETLLSSLCCNVPNPEMLLASIHKAQEELETNSIETMIDQAIASVLLETQEAQDATH